MAKTKLWSKAEATRRITELKKSLVKLEGAKDPEGVSLVARVQQRIRAYETIRPNYEKWVKTQKKVKSPKPKK